MLEPFTLLQHIFSFCLTEKNEAKKFRRNIFTVVYFMALIMELNVNGKTNSDALNYMQAQISICFYLICIARSQNIRLWKEPFH